MTYQERSISKDNLEKFLSTLDSDEGIRIDNESGHVFINKTSKRYCINISNNGKDEFIYKNSVKDTIEYLQDYITQTSKIFAY
jgi:ribosome biogenesis protein Nip4